eukprot:CAMPEP_0197288428 /NCGR_PEP_ID=MMETSP0890-20130614/5516_1 /TAXON_ID=44058 ORGANISM="Aureoumbra lagunensis, Strain CCMP1510" /NCGR_SAMPLE_ID=MMETSP0890 /ASSEMBLY_ACC=CAM_ASM_000533 /LENGTH=171 /DNA_ID=CAMNT_0042759153 /DNA_START=51 /DNA_END=565 /DNA_ORIENTATION=+
MDDACFFLRQKEKCYFWCIKGLEPMHARAMLEQASAIHSCLGISGEVHERTTTIRWKSGEQELAEIVRGVLLDLKSALDTEEKTDESRLTKEEEKEEKKKSELSIVPPPPKNVITVPKSATTDAIIDFTKFVVYMLNDGTFITWVRRNDNLDTRLSHERITRYNELICFYE